MSLYAWACYILHGSFLSLLHTAWNRLCMVTAATRWQHAPELPAIGTEEQVDCMIGNIHTMDEIFIYQFAGHALSVWNLQLLNFYLQWLVAVDA